MTLKVLDLFSGIGGFSLGLERAGMETVAFCEFDKHAQKVLKKHWPDVPIYEDVRELDGKQFRGSVDVVCGGYPCQPFSVAGLQRGAEDDRHLWPEMLRIIKQARPSWLVAENVTGHITLGLDKVLSDLEVEGYTSRTLVIPACALNAHHRRDRVWIIAHTNSPGRREGNKTMEREEPKQLNRWSVQSKQTNTNSGSTKLQRSTPKSVSWVSDIQSKLTGSGEVVGIIPCPSEPRISGITNGFPGRVDRIKRLGNAVVPQIPEAIGRAILEVAA